MVISNTNVFCGICGVGNRMKIINCRLLAQPSSNEYGTTKPLVLRRLDADNQLVEENGHGFTVKFTVTQACVPPSDADDFIQYLSSGKLFVDVWDSDALIHVGVCSIPLRVSQVELGIRLVN